MTPSRLHKFIYGTWNTLILNLKHFNLSNSIHLTLNQGSLNLFDNFIEYCQLKPIYRWYLSVNPYHRKKKVTEYSHYLND